MEKLTLQNNKEKIFNQYEDFEILNIQFENIITNIEAEISEITKNVLNGGIDIIQSTKVMQELSENTMREITGIFSAHLNIPADELPFTLFFFGSPVRNLMLPNSDLDIGLVYVKNCDEGLKKYLEEKINLLPFDKIDIADWHYVDEMMENNCNSMIEYNKSVDAKYIVGNRDIANIHQERVKESDGKEAKVKRFITEFGIFHLYDYKNKKTDYGENLKYDYGGSRDIIFLDWYYAINSGLEDKENDSSSPFYERGLDILEKQKVISPEDHQELKKIVEIILLVKFTLLSKFKEG
jgi:UTP:GlnB (protein PII) uridylyltransferase